MNNIQTYAKVLKFTANSRDIETIRNINMALTKNTNNESDIEELRRHTIELIDSCTDSSTLHDAMLRYIDKPFTNTYYL
jgi:ribosomal protein S3AE